MTLHPKDNERQTYYPLKQLIEGTPDILEILDAFKRATRRPASILRQDIVDLSEVIKASNLDSTQLKLLRAYCVNAEHLCNKRPHRSDDSQAYLCLKTHLDVLIVNEMTGII